MRIAAIERLGFGYEAVSQINPRIVYCAADRLRPGWPGPRPARLRRHHPGRLRAGERRLPAGATHTDYAASLIADKTTGLVGRRMPCWPPCSTASAMATASAVEVPMLETMAAFALAEHMGGLAFPSGSPATGRLCAGC